MEQTEYTGEILRTCISSELSISPTRHWFWEVYSHLAKSFSPISPVNYRRWAVGLGIAGVFLVALISLLSLNTRGDEAALVLVVDPPDGLRVVMDGATLIPDNTSPVRVAYLEPGKHVVTIEKRGYLDSQLEVEIKTGKGVSRGVLLKRIEGGIELATEPAGATVWIDERPLEVKTPFVLKGISPGTHLVRIAKGNEYAPEKIFVVVEQDKVTKVPMQRLQRKIVEVSFESKPAGAMAYLITGAKRASMGLTPAKAVLDLSRSYRVRYDLPGYRGVEKELNNDELGATNPTEGEIVVFEAVLRSQMELNSNREAQSQIADAPAIAYHRSSPSGVPLRQ